MNKKVQSEFFHVMQRLMESYDVILQYIETFENFGIITDFEIYTEVEVSLANCRQVYDGVSLYFEDTSDKRLEYLLKNDIDVLRDTLEEDTEFFEKLVRELQGVSLDENIQLDSNIWDTLESFKSVIDNYKSKKESVLLLISLLFDEKK